MPQRVIENEFLRKLESGNALTRLIRALRSGLAYRKLSGASLGELLSAAASMRQTEKLTRTQTLMAAIAPIFIKRAMVEGKWLGGSARWCVFERRLRTQRSWRVRPRRRVSRCRMPPHERPDTRLGGRTRSSPARWPACA
jgi:hypothetical protein